MRFDIFENDATADNGPTALQQDFQTRVGVLEDAFKYAQRENPDVVLTLRQSGNDFHMYFDGSDVPFYVIQPTTWPRS